MSLLESLFLVSKGALRLSFVLINNAYCIPTYVVWMILLFPLRKLNPEVYWRIEGYFFHWLLAMVSMWSWTAGYDIVELGDDIRKCMKERTLVIANHQSTADVPLLMASFNTKPNVLPNIMWIMDRLFKYTNFGIVSVLHQDFFIISGKDNREGSLQALVKHILNSYVPRQRLWMVLFPEGGFLRKRRETSKRYALKNDLPVLQNVSLPRVGALQAIMDTVGCKKYEMGNNNADSSSNNFSESIITNNLAWILDITIAYPDGKPLDLPTIILGYRPPCKTLLFYRLYPCSEVPMDHEEMTSWLYARFEEKEHMLEVFYRTGDIPSEQYCQSPTPPQLVTQDCLRFFILHLFFITSTYVHIQMFYAVYEYYSYLMY
ncbi:hypothetical protein CBL_01977 [Carabus blaptoides fortunei]